MNATKKIEGLPTMELTYQTQNTFEDEFPFSQVGYDSSLEGEASKRNGLF